jgi:hypothetical protein
MRHREIRRADRAADDRREGSRPAASGRPGQTAADVTSGVRSGPTCWDVTARRRRPRIPLHVVTVAGVATAGGLHAEKRHHTLARRPPARPTTASPTPRSVGLRRHPGRRAHAPSRRPAEGRDRLTRSPAHAVRSGSPGRTPRRRPPRTRRGGWPPAEPTAATPHLPHPGAAFPYSARPVRTSALDRFGSARRARRGDGGDGPRRCRAATPSYVPIDQRDPAAAGDLGPVCPFRRRSGPAADGLARVRRLSGGVGECAPPAPDSGVDSGRLVCSVRRNPTR